MNNERVQPHKVIINDRCHTELTGITEVMGFDDHSITANSYFGEMMLEGESLRVENFSSEKELLTISGKINGLYYFDREIKRNSLKKRSSEGR